MRKITRERLDRALKIDQRSGTQKKFVLSTPNPRPRDLQLILKLSNRDPKRRLDRVVI